MLEDHEAFAFLAQEPQPGHPGLMRTLRFGLLWQGDGSPAEAARRAEDAGYSALVFPDHTRKLSPLPAMAAAAAVTSRIRLGTQVVNVAFRPLGALAQDLAAVDVISDGRLEAGLGAGTAEGEVRSLGLPFPRPGERVREVERTLELLPRLFAGETITESPGPGRLHDFRLDPVPPQGAAVPLLVGGSRDKMLAVAARRATIVQFFGFAAAPQGRTYQGFSPAGLTERIAYVRSQAGDRFPQIELAAMVQSAGIAADPLAAARQLGAVSSGAVTAEEALNSPFVQLGRTPAEVADQITELHETHGISYLTVFAARSAGFDKVIARLV
jgi:probable F420-dependent oxidoreductase